MFPLASELLLVCSFGCREYLAQASSLSSMAVFCFQNQHLPPEFTSFLSIHRPLNHIKNALSSTLNSPNFYSLICKSYKLLDLLSIWILPDKIVQISRVILWQISAESSILYSHSLCFLCGPHPSHFLWLPDMFTPTSGSIASSFHHLAQQMTCLSTSQRKDRLLRQKLYHLSSNFSEFVLYYFLFRSIYKNEKYLIFQGLFFHLIYGFYSVLYLPEVISFPSPSDPHFILLYWLLSFTK